MSPDNPVEVRPIVERRSCNLCQGVMTAGVFSVTPAAYEVEFSRGGTSGALIVLCRDHLERLHEVTGAVLFADADDSYRELWRPNTDGRAAP